MYCPSCGTEVSAQNRQCPECGVTLSQDEQGGQGTQPTQGEEDGAGQTPPQQPGSGPEASGQPIGAGGDQPRQAGGGQQQPTQGGSQPPGQGGHQQPTQGAQPGSPQQPGQGAQHGGGARQGGHQQATGMSTSLLSDLPIVGGVIYGTLSYLISFAFITGFVLLEIEGSDGLGVLPAEDSVDAMVALLGWFFYSAHSVQIAGSTGDETINVLEETYSAAVDPVVPKLAYYVVPALLLLLFGLLLASRASMEEPVSRFDSARAGATIGVGYVVLTALGAMTVFSYGSGAVTIQPQLGSAVLIMGLVYPVAIGGLAGYLTGG